MIESIIIPPLSQTSDSPKTGQDDDLIILQFSTL